MEHKGYMTVQEIFGDRAAASRFESILFAQAVTSGSNEFAVLASDAEYIDMHVMGAGMPTRVIVRDNLIPLHPTEMEGQLDMLRSPPQPPPNTG